jgi:DsbC/DsbD-like thiol-disulfide interchange protein
MPILTSITFLLALLPLFAVSFALAQSHGPVKSKGSTFAPLSDTKVQFTLLTDAPVATPGQSITLGLRFTIAPHWHIYWNGSNDTGTPPTWKVEAPTNWSIDDTAKQGRFWPVPVRYISPADTIDHVYFDDVVLLQSITIPTDASPGTYPITINAKWLVCEDACLPEKGSATIKIMVIAAGEKPTLALAAASKLSVDRPLIEQSRARTPKPLPPQTSSDIPVAHRAGEKGVIFAAMVNGPGVLRFMPASTSLPLLDVLAKGEVQKKELPAKPVNRASMASPPMCNIELRVDTALADSMLEQMGLDPEADPLIEGVVEGIVQTDSAAYWVRVASPEVIQRERAAHENRQPEALEATTNVNPNNPTPPK